MPHGTHQELNLERKRENSPGYGTQAKSPIRAGTFFVTGKELTKVSEMGRTYPNKGQGTR